MAMGNEARDVLRGQGYAVEWHEYPMQHEVCAEELADIGRWLRRRLADEGSVAGHDGTTAGGR
jgi:phospholipase/carboxylesterase